MKEQHELFNTEAVFTEFMRRFQRLEEYVEITSALLKGWRKISTTEPKDKKLITPLEAAKLLQVSKRTLFRYKQNGKISFVKYDSGKVMYYYDDIVDFLNKNRQVYESQ